MKIRSVIEDNRNKQHVVYFTFISTKRYNVGDTILLKGKKHEYFGYIKYKESKLISNELIGDYVSYYYKALIETDDGHPISNDEMTYLKDEYELS